MKRGHLGRGLVATLILSAVAVLAVAIFAGGASAQSVAPKAGACTANSSTRNGNFVGVVHAQPASGCQAHITDDAANGTPPLIWHKGPVMGTPSTGPVVVTPIFWDPAGHPMASTYKSIITRYLGDVAAASGTHTNVFSTLNEYFGSNGNISYQVRLGTPIDDTSPLPKNSCNLTSADRTGIYADGSGYDACIDDAQVVTETENVVAAKGLPVDLAHIYVLFIAKHVETCFTGGGTATAGNACTINHEPSGAYCAYHSQTPHGLVYANLSFPIYDSPTGFTCSSDAVYPTVQAPNGDPDADTEVSPTSHEIMEAITDPDTHGGWYDSSGFENGDECAYIFGSTKGRPGRFYNQVINGDRYLTQEEFSNQDFFQTGLGCLQGE
ncbi:MAG TPA: hypothetical protein VE985_06600 [Gaiellaceae bacterium]|nr:hypothetical protein [Gaiellaceae bacterium]